MLKVGVIGIGGISGYHMASWKLIENAEVAAICDIRPERMDRYPEIRHYPCFEDMVANEKLDILDICLPSYLHAEYAIRAMDLGINVITEKPISLHTEDVKKIYDASRRNHVKFMVAQVIRFWPEWAMLKEIYDTGKYGKLITGTMQRMGGTPGSSWENWMRDEKRSGLVPFDLHVHDVDFLVYMLGKPVSVQHYRARRPDQDYVHTTFEYDTCSISAEAAWCAQPYPFVAGYRFLFENALVEKTRDQMVIYDKTGAHPVEFPKETLKVSTTLGNMNPAKVEPYRNEIAYFADCVANGKPVEKVREDELLTVLEILNQL